MSIRLTKLNCPNCGAPLQHRVGMPIATCPFCESKIAIEIARERGREVEVEAHKMRCFTTTKAGFEAALLDWLADGEYTPDDTLSAVMVSDYTGVFVPLFKYTGEYRANFSASAGYTRSETRYRTVTDDDGSKRQESYTKKVTDWRPMSGEASDQFTHWGCATRQVPAVYLTWCETQTGAQSGGWKDLNDEDIAGFALESFEQNADEVFKARVRTKVDSDATTLCKSRVPGDKCKDLEVSFRVQDRKEGHHYLPFWIASLKYQGTDYHYIHSGSADDFVGNRPEDTERREKVKALMKPFYICAVVFAVIGVLGIPLSGGILTVAAVLIGGPFSIFMYLRAKKKQKSILARSKEVRRRLLEKVKQRGGLRGSGVLSVGSDDLEQIQSEMSLEDAAAEEHEVEEKKTAKAEKQRDWAEKNPVQIDTTVRCHGCEAVLVPDAESCEACGAFVGE